MSWKENERVGWMKAMIRETLYAVGLFIMPIFSFVSTGVRKRERGHTWRRKDKCHHRWKGGEEDFAMVYIHSCPKGSR